MSRSLALAAMCTGFFVVILDTTIVNVALPAIGRDLGGGTSDLQWIVAAYTLVFAALLLNGGALSDRLGPRRVFLGGLLAFALASALCAIAPSLGVLIAGRALQGAAGAVMVPSSLSLIAHTFPEPPARARAFGIWIGASAGASAVGPVLGGLLVAGPGWRAIFLVNLPVALVGTTLAVRHVSPPPRAPGRGLDLPGQVLAVVFLFGLTAALIEVGARGWGSPWVVAPLLAGAVGAALFIAVESRSRSPMVPVRLFRSARFSSASVIGALVNLGYYGQIFVLSLYFQDIHGYSALVTGLAFLPLTGATFFLAFAAGRLTARLGPALPMALGLGIGLAGFLALLVVEEGSSYWVLVPGLTLLSLGAMIPAPLSMVMVSSAPDEQSGIVSGILNASRQVGGAFGVAVFGSLVAGGSFVSGMRQALLVAAVAYGASLALTLRFLRMASRAEAVTAPAMPSD
jgi:DHA2 family methylenomycin A resistance protein-like MFS transporter